MTWLAPWFLVAGGIGALATIAAHMLSRHRPMRAVLPTARFVPAARPISATRLAQPSDLMLLALRALVVLLLGAALAQPTLLPKRGSVARVMLVDRSHDVADVRQLAGVASQAGPADVVILFDSAPAPALAGRPAAAALERLSLSPARGSISAALVSGIDAARGLRLRADSVELVLISPLAPGEIDAATRAIRNSWPGRLRTIRVDARPNEPSAAVALSTTTDDPIAATFALAGLGAANEDASVRVVRSLPSAADSQWARTAGRTLVVWPRDGSSPGWARRPIVDSIAGVIAQGTVVTGPFVRVFQAPAGHAVARWSDGEVAAAELALDGGCIRNITIPVSGVGDLVLRPSMRKLVRALTSQCAKPGEDFLAASSADTNLTWITAAGPLVSARALARLASSEHVETPLVPWLLGAVLVLLGLEMLVRDRWRRREVA